MTNYFSQIPNLKFKPVSPKIFKTILYEGLDEETGCYSISQWLYAELKITEADKQGLKKFTTRTVEKFNQFDIDLKDRYKLRLIDFIDYDTGKVIIVTCKVRR